MVLLICKKLHLWANVQPQSRPDGFPWVFDPSRSQLSQNEVPIVPMMFLYEARARAPCTGTSSAQLGPHFGLTGTRRDVIWGLMRFKGGTGWAMGGRPAARP